jgi:hypothetical protein
LLPASGLGWIRRGHVITEDSDWLRAKVTSPQARHSSQDGTDGFAAPGAPWHRITKCQKSKEAQLARCKVGSAGCNIWSKTSRHALRGRPCRASSSRGEGRLNRWSKDCHESRPRGVTRSELEVGGGAMVINDVSWHPRHGPGQTGRQRFLQFFSTFKLSRRYFSHGSRET